MKIGRLAALAGLLMVADAAGQSRAADQTGVWKINATFSDGGTLSGFISTNYYGYISTFDLVTTLGATFSGANYINGQTTSGGGGANVFNYFTNGASPDSLILTFANSLQLVSGNNQITGGGECTATRLADLTPTRG
jgi:hypothetical protein